MKLDPNTLLNVAEMICDDEGPYERKGYQLPGFLERAGWASPPDHDGSPKVGWLVECLTERAHEAGAIEQVLCRLCDPREYPGEPEAAGAVRKDLNRHLLLDGFKVGYEGGRPTVIETTPRIVGPAESAPVVLVADLGALIPDPVKLRVIRERLDEAATCREYNAPVAAIIMLASALEGVLLVVDEVRDPVGLRNLTPIRNGRRPDVSLEKLIRFAYEKKWLQKNAGDFSHLVRGLRNYVHARAQWANDERLNGDTVQICWDVTIAAINELGTSRH